MMQKTFTAGLLAILAGCACAAAIYAHPEQLKVPAWVAYAAALAFVFAGIAMALQPIASPRLYNGIIALLLACMLAPPAWIAFWPGTRMCSASVFGWASLTGDTVCRATFGLGAIVVALLLLMAIWRASKP